MNVPTAYKANKTKFLDALRQQAHLRSSVAVKKALQDLAKLTDETLRDLWAQCDLGETLSLVAVGGYGRGELFPYSDVDVLVLLPNGLESALENAVHQETLTQVEKFIGLCWDCGLEIGSSVRTLEECLSEASSDITIQTSLLEARLIGGDTRLFNNFQLEFFKNMDPKAFFIAKTLEMNQRHIKFENTPYALEPNCKESPGGLRDLQILLWLSKACGFGKSWDEMAKNALATPLEAKKIKKNETLLNLIRMRLHLVAKRREDRLIFDFQAQVATELGLASVLDEAKSARAASEALMKEYYWCAKAVTQLNQILLLNIEEKLNPNDMFQVPKPINERFSDKAGMLEVNTDDLYQRQPHAILETFHLYQTTVGIKGLSAKTLRALYNARDVMGPGFRKDPVNRAQFLSILKEPQGITHAFRLMNQTSVLGRYLWVFRRIVGQMQHDLFHVYTVDQHILMVLRNVRRFFIVEHAHEYPFCSQLAAGWDKPWVLFVAALFHDIAKGRGGDHSKLGKAEVRKFCREHQIAKEDMKLVEFLVGEHLSMSHIAQKLDLSDPGVIFDFAKRVKNERNLTALYLLTVADIRGTSPKVWNAWKGKLLEDLYRSTLRALGGRAPDASAEVETRKREALSLLALYALPSDAHQNLWSNLDVSYFMRHDAPDIAWHTRQLSRNLFDQEELAKGAQARNEVLPRKSLPSSIVVRARLSNAGEGLQVMVYTPDQVDLFARICGYFDQAGFSILDAKVHTAKNGFALDTFQVVCDMLEEHYRELIYMVEHDLTQTLINVNALPKVSKGRVSRRVKNFPIQPRVTLMPDEKAQRWLLNISASDRIGLLYSVALILAKHKINLLLAKVSTLGERVEDTFLIDGAALQHNKIQIEMETELLEALSA
ncbi:MAG: [protein-PII] uridylyltransferase [Burkholderiaceae bacterium]